MGLVYFGISGLLISLLTIRLLEDRGIGLGQLEEISILVLVSLGIIYNICLIPIHGPDSLLYICRLVFIFPFLISISIVDAATRWVYDIDILGGILVSELIFSLRILENLLDNINNVDKIWSLLYNNIIGLILLFGLSYGLYRVTRGIGMGDVLTFTMVGTMGGLIDSLMVFFMSFISAGLYCIVIMIMNRMDSSKRDGLIAFTPFISIGFVVTYEIIKLI